MNARNTAGKVLVSHVEPLDLEKTPKTYERSDRREEGVTKVLLKP